MILNFLQRRNPPILPSLQKISGKRQNGAKDEDTEFADDLEALKGYGDANKESLAELLFQFFRHYSYEFDFSKYVVSVKEGRLLSRLEKGWQPTNYMDKEARCRLCVEEPFTTNRNLGNSADDYAWSGIHGELRRAFEFLADGCQLDKACEEFVFPPEEKPIFQKPIPKPKPILTRSASQTGSRAPQEQGSGRSSRKSNRNSSTQRNGNRRASSGASFSNQRVAMPFHTSPMGPNFADYFALKGNLHDQLYQQYQYLQAQQDALRSQLQAQQAAQGRVGDLAASSPHLRAYTNGIGSPRLFDSPPQTAPILPGYLYQFPTRLSHGAPLTQVRSREGSSTNPSSPSLSTAAPSLRRQSQRTSLPGESTGSLRSQSQPGRTLPHPLTLQQPPLPSGYDMASILAAQQQQQNRAMQTYTQSSHPLPQHPFSPLGPMQPMQPLQRPTGSLDSAMPKEYVGYYVGQSPQLGPQPQVQYASHAGPMPPMTLRDPPPQRQRRVTPDLAPPLANGRHTSRSPSPLSNTRDYPSKTENGAVQPPMPLSPPVQSTSIPPSVSSMSPDLSTGGPLIVNGSTPSKRQVSLESQALSHTTAEVSTSETPTTEGTDPFVEKRHDTPEREHSPVRSKPLPPLTLVNSPVGHPQTPQRQVNGLGEQHLFDVNPLSAAPLLSPVAELRTPSPTQTHSFEKHGSPLANGLSRNTGNTAENAAPSSPLREKRAGHDHKVNSSKAPEAKKSDAAPRTRPSPPSRASTATSSRKGPPNPNTVVISNPTPPKESTPQSANTNPSTLR